MFSQMICSLLDANNSNFVGLEYYAFLSKMPQIYNP